MRDGLRLRERIQLSLDDRQLAALAVGALLLLGGMFALGLLVGMQVARRSPQPAPMGDLVALDQQRSAEPRAKIAAAQARPQTTAATVASPAPEQPAQNAPAAAPVVRIAPPPKKEVPAPPATVNIAPARTVDVAPADPGGPLPPPPSRLGKYTVQIGASQHRAEALQLAAQAGTAGLKAYVVEARLPTTGLWYRVRVGAFSDKNAANRYRRDVERELRTSAVVMPTH
ncbi:MAG TPA: SPOR domain-containing protein [Myxococcales bacterium]|nr:SPOR domain-containing protein [Myxococcales bacterium]